MDITLTLGKYYGKKLSEVPVSYVQWLSEQATIDGKTTVPQAARAYLASLSGGVQLGKTCMHCRREIVEEAIPVQERTQSGGRIIRQTTRYLHPACAQQLAAEEE